MLKFVVDKLEDVAEALRDYYEPKDGKFVLKVEGAKSQADIDKQLSANQAERTAHTKTKQDLASANEKLKVWGDLEPDTVLGQLTELETLKAAGPNAKADDINKKAEEIAATKFGQEKQKLQRDLVKVTGERDALLKETGDLKTSISTRSVDDAVREAATALKVLPEAVGDLTLLARSAFKITDGKVLTEDGRDPNQWLEDRKKTSPYLWAPAKGAGAGGQGGGDTTGENPFSGKGWNLTKQGQMVQQDPAKAKTMAEQAGTTVGGPRPKVAA